MTLSLASLNSSGIVLTADSRQTYPNSAGMTRIGTDNANKLFQLSNKVGIVIAGKAFFYDDKKVFKSTGWFIEKFKNEAFKDEWTIEEIAAQLNDYCIKVFVEPEESRLKDIFTKEITEKIGGTEIAFQERAGLTVSYSYIKDEKKVEKKFYIDSISFIVAGIDKDNIGKAFLGLVPEKPTVKRDTEFGGPLWIGQTEVVTRIIKGFSWELSTLPFIQDAKAKGIDVDDGLSNMEYIINWNIMTLQDSVDFCVLLTQITESIQRFSDGTFMNPGGITGVGGPIDIVTITVEGGFKWIAQKEVTA